MYTCILYHFCTKDWLILGHVFWILLNLDKISFGTKFTHYLNVEGKWVFGSKIIERTTSLSKPGGKISFGTKSYRECSHWVIPDDITPIIFGAKTYFPPNLANEIAPYNFGANGPLWGASSLAATQCRQPMSSLPIVALYSLEVQKPFYRIFFVILLLLHFHVCFMVYEYLSASN